ncbi:DUF5316 family protein [Lentibacillus sp. CBA3610]|uniref:DUF5316 family protein n=1 Tax=Lentibacillus sp. CBA3610 TaxID=2518176 RepID=UPI001595CFAA|nr:DUF5316 family protein [Lentibacillus sp. CBA3610]
MMTFFLIVGVICIFVANIFMGGLRSSEQQQTTFHTEYHEPRSVRLKPALYFGLAGFASLGISALIYFL